MKSSVFFFNFYDCMPCEVVVRTNFELLTDFKYFFPVQEWRCNSEYDILKYFKGNEIRVTLVAYGSLI